jgi:hypothetical protein
MMGARPGFGAPHEDTARMTIPRIVAAETLDHLAADDPAAIRSRRDLMRVHRAMGTRTLYTRALRALLPAPQDAAPLRLLELGAGSGTLMLGVARKLAPAWPQVELTLLDRQDVVGSETIAAYAALGWAAAPRRIDVLDWAAGAPERWDLITTSLFLHHFEGAALDALLGAITARTDRFFACEPLRGRWPLAGSHLIFGLGANAVTRNDAVLSVHAGFCGRELTALWPDPAGAWRTEEYDAGLFGHCFCAQRDRAP